MGSVGSSQARLESPVEIFKSGNAHSHRHPRKSDLTGLGIWAFTTPQVSVMSSQGGEVPGHRQE